MPIKMLAADLDGTLLNHDARLTPFSRETLASAHRAGIKLVFATGRAFESVPREIKEFSGADYLICSNGAAICDLQAGRLLWECTIPTDSARDLIDFARKGKLGLELFCAGKAYGEAYYFDHPKAFGFDARSIHYLHATRSRIAPAEFEAFVDTHLSQFEAIDFVLPDPMQKQAIEAAFAADDALYITSSHPRILEFSSKESGKEKALAFLLEREKLSPEALAAFGNAENDAAMLRMARIGVATQDSPAAVKAQADYICGSCNEDGVARFIREHILNK